MPFASDTKRKMLRCITNAIDDDVRRKINTINQDARDAVYQLDVVDTRATAEATKAEYKKQGDNRTLSFFTPTTVKNKYGTYYPVFPFYGWGSSRRYGARNWLRLGAAKAMFSLGYSVKNLPNPNETFRK